MLPVRMSAMRFLGMMISTSHTGFFTNRIGAYLAQRSNLDKDERKEASLQLARQMKTTMAMAKLPQKMSADLFLEALYAIHRSNG